MVVTAQQSRQLSRSCDLFVVSLGLERVRWAHVQNVVLFICRLLSNLRPLEAEGSWIQAEDHINFLVAKIGYRLSGDLCRLGGYQTVATGLKLEFGLNQTLRLNLGKRAWSSV